MALCDRFVFLILLWSLTLTDGLQADTFTPSRGCAIPMTEWKQIGFVTTTGDVSQAEYNCNITWYNFGYLDCTLEHISAGGRESYRCQTGKILETGNFPTDLWINEIAGPICRTDKQPKISENAVNHFICEDTTTVHSALLISNVTTHDDEADLKYFIAPLNFRSLTEVLSNGSVREHHLAIPPFFVDVVCTTGHTFRYPQSFDCHWIKCGSLLLHGRGTANSGQDLEDSLRYILKKVSIPTSLEITETKLSHLPRIIWQLSELQRLAAVGNSIKTLPKCLHKMVGLKILDVSFNELETVENLMFGSQSEKTYLDLSSNHIHDISQDAFSQLENLVFLSVANNSITEIRFQLPQNLWHIDFSYNNIRYLQPSTIFVKLFKIGYLNLRYNDIQTVNFSFPSSLTYLDLSHNHIHIIDGDMFKNAKNLTCLLLQHNHIKRIQFSSEDLPPPGFNNLETLHLSNNDIETLDGFPLKEKLEYLSLANNRIKSVDLGMLQKAKYLKALVLQFNEISEIKDDVLIGTEEIKILPNLTYMNVSHNQLKVAPLSLIFLNVAEIDFSYNKIEKCTWSNRSEDNILKNIDDKITSCLRRERDRHKNIIYLNHNKLRSLKDVFGNASIMMYKDASLFCSVSLNDNPFHCDCHLYPYLKLLHDFLEQAGYTKTADSPPHFLGVSHSPYSWSDMSDAATNTRRCQTPSKLTSYRILDKTILDKLECNLVSKEICEVIFKPSNNLLSVNCSNLKLTNMSSADSFVHSLPTSVGKYQVLGAADAHIHLNGIAATTNLTTDFLNFFLLLGDVLKIRRIDLRNINASTIHWRFFVLLGKFFPFLDSLHLNDNNLTMLPLQQINSYYSEVKDSGQPFWEKLVELHLYNNPWDCSCENIELKTWLNKLLLLDRNVLVQHRNITCATPEHLRGETVYMLQDNEFCPDSTLWYVMLVLFFCTVLLIIGLVVGYFTLKWDKTITVPSDIFDMINDDDVTDMKFDAFVSYCEHDAEWVENDLIRKLENHNPPYKICLHKRDFEVGMPSKLNEFNAIRHSRRVIIVMSKLYLERDHCRHEFEVACFYWHVIKENPRVLVIKYPDVDPLSLNQYQMCEAYFKTYTYLEKDEHIFDRLFESMPKKSLAQIKAEHGEDDSSSDSSEDEYYSVCEDSDQPGEGYGDQLLREIKETVKRKWPDLSGDEVLGVTSEVWEIKASNSDGSDDMSEDQVYDLGFKRFKQKLEEEEENAGK